MRVLTGFLTLSLCASAQTLTWQIDSAHSAAQFAVRHMMVSTVRGDFGKLSGKAVLDLKDPANGSSVEITIDATTINTRETARDTHLKSVDFFDVAKFPTIAFKSKKVDAAGPGKLKLTGDLTLHGVTKEVVFDVEGPSPELKDARGSRIGASASTKINRKDFGLMWNRAIEAGGVVVGDEVTVTVDVELVRK